jgi:DNA-binding CsgD family transcriptional regulator
LLAVGQGVPRNLSAFAAQYGMGFLRLDDPVTPSDGAGNLFDLSGVAVLVTDDKRRFLASNHAACVLLRTSHEALLASTIDSLTPPERRADQETRWAAFLTAGSQRGTFELVVPRGYRVIVDYYAIGYVAPGLHLVILSQAAQESGSWGPPGPPRHQLSVREREVLTRVAMGDSSVQVARALHIAPATVETHVRHCLAKLDARNRAHAVTRGLQNGEITMGDGEQRL